MVQGWVSLNMVHIGHGSYGIISINFDRSTKLYSIVPQIGTCLLYKTRMHCFENGADQTHDALQRGMHCSKFVFPTK